MTVNKWDHGWDVWPLYFVMQPVFMKYVQDSFRAKSVLLQRYASSLLRPSPISTLIKGEDGQIKRQRLSGSPQTLLCTATFGDPHVVMLSDRCLCSGSRQSLPRHMKPGLRGAQQIKNLVTFKWKFSHGKLTEVVYFTARVSVATLQLSPKLPQKLSLLQNLRNPELNRKDVI